MANFKLEIDTILLDKYFNLQASGIESPQKTYLLDVDRYSTNESVMVITERFNEITKKYDIVDHTDNLMFITLNKVVEYDTIYKVKMQDNQLALRHKELAIVLNSAILAIETNHTTLVLKTIEDDHRITDRKLLEWIYNLVLTEAVRGKLLTIDFGFPKFLFKPMGRINMIELRKALNAKVEDNAKFQHRLIRDLNADFCFSLRPYLNGETKLKKQSGHNFSDIQLNFMYDLLLLFDMIKDREFGLGKNYEPKDYLSSTLTTYAKSITREGKKSKKNE